MKVPTLKEIGTAFPEGYVLQNRIPGHLLGQDVHGTFTGWDEKGLPLFGGEVKDVEINHNDFADIINALDADGIDIEIREIGVCSWRYRHYGQARRIVWPFLNGDSIEDMVNLDLLDDPIMEDDELFLASMPPSYPYSGVSICINGYEIWERPLTDPVAKIREMAKEMDRLCRETVIDAIMERGASAKNGERYLVPERLTYMSDTSEHLYAVHYYKKDDALSFETTDRNGIVGEYQWEACDNLQDKIIIATALTPSRT
jgi:hypothetical protein